MKFEIDAKEFINAAKRALTTTDPKSSLEEFRSVYIEASDGEIVLKSGKVDSFVKIKVPATVIEAGKACVGGENIKKLFNFSNKITVSSAENELLVENFKKKSKIPAPELDELEFPTEEMKLVYTVEKDEFIDTLKRLSAFLSKDDNRGVHKGYYFNSDTKEIVAINGAALLIKNLSDKWTINNNINPFVVSPIVLKEMEKIAKANENLEIYSSKGYTMIKANDYEYYVKNLEGSFLNYKQVLTGAYSESFTINRKVGLELFKEYADILKGYNSGKEKVHPFYIYFENSELTTCIYEHDYATMDKIEVSNNTVVKENVYAFDPLLLKNCFNSFADTDVKIEIFSPTHGIKLYCGEYLGFILPVKGKDTSEIINFIKQ